MNMGGNLIAFLCSVITVDDLSNIMHRILKRSSEVEKRICEEVESPESEETTATLLHPGEHIIAFWLIGSSIKWYLGVVESVKVVVFYIVRTNPWIFPETAEVLETEWDQILATKVPVQYLATVTIKCRIDAEQIITECNNAVMNM